MKTDTFAERLNAAMKTAGFTQASLAEAVGMAQPSVWKLTSGMTRHPRKLHDIAKVLNVSAEWLSSGEGLMRPLPPNESKIEGSNIRPSTLTAKVWEEIEEQSVVQDEFVEIPLLNVALAAGDGSCDVEESSELALIFRRYYLKKMGVPEKAARLVRVSGQSMEPTLNDGDMVGVNTQDITIRDGKTYAICQADLLRVKTLIALPDSVIIRSLNREEYPDEVLSREDFHRNVRVIGKVFWSSHSW
ncbi:MAG: HTH-type transcriptional regulator PrtR [Candidatus Erwinia impunctatus]|nr:HTH-type transcriptional regulator PrtR [Culicoides impunctatus]